MKTHSVLQGRLLYSNQSEEIQQAASCFEQGTRGRCDRPPQLQHRWEGPWDLSLCTHTQGKEKQVK